ncbi:MAG: transcriptional regulator [Thermomicrobiales bacterium]|nr:transcriptional regulator [Thermomicrobiales bacterium]
MFGCGSGLKGDALDSGPRCRNAKATRQAILEAAKICFMHDGYEQVGVREIAARAGVDPSLVNRYFGSKEGLFSEAVASKFDLRHLLDGDRATLGERLARYVLQKKSEGADYDPLVALLRSSSSDVCSGMLRNAILEGFVRPLAARLDGPDALSRAELVGSTLLGLLVHRTVIGGAEAVDNERMLALVAPALQTFIDGTQ